MKILRLGLKHHRPEMFLYVTSVSKALNSLVRTHNSQSTAYLIWTSYCYQIEEAQPPPAELPGHDKKI